MTKRTNLGWLAPLVFSGFFGCSSEGGRGMHEMPDAGGMVMPDAGPAKRMGDSLPTGAISFFSRVSCPAGWEPFSMAVGRTVVPGTSTDSGITDGEPLGDAEDRLHGHTAGASLALLSVGYSGIAGEANHGVARSDAAPLAFAIDKAASGLPYVQLLMCQKTAAPVATAPKAPSGTLMFFMSAGCPNGWGQPMVTQGRFLVGLPDNGNPSQSFGGAPLGTSPDPFPVQGEKRTHRHTLPGNIKTTSHGIALFGGSTDGYAKDDTYPYRVPSDESGVDFPYVRLLQCQKL